MKSPAVAATLAFLSFSLGCGGSPVPAEPGFTPTPLLSANAPTCSPRIICDVVMFRISGVATDEDGRPVAGATITIAPWKFGESPPQIALTTDAAGRYVTEFEAMRDAVGGVGNSVAEQPGHETN